MGDYKITGCGLNNYIYDSIDKGVTWVKQPGSNSTVWRSIAGSSDGKKLIACAYTNTGGVYLSNDSGVKWNMEPTSDYIGFVNVASSSDGMILYACEYGYVISRSIDGGITWNGNYDTQGYWRCVSCSADGKIVIAAGDLAIFKLSMDSGNTFTQVTGMSDTADWRGLACSNDGKFIVAADFKDKGYIWTIRLTENNDVQVKKQIYNEYGWFSVECSGNGSTIVAVARWGEVYISYNYGEDWIKKWTHDNSNSITYGTVACSKDGMCLLSTVMYYPD